MNIYVVVEGESTEKKVYDSWIPLVNPKLRRIDYLPDFTSDNYLIIAGLGYPYYFNIIENAIEDINSQGNIDRLVIAVDSEEMSYTEKFSEVADFIKDHPCKADIRIIIQHFCFESWALGNKKIIGRSVQDITLLKYKRFYNVLSQDPELMPAYTEGKLNRVLFAYKYLALAFREKYKHLVYSKRSPNPLLNRNYFEQLRNRLQETNHIKSFESFINSFL